MLLLKKVSILAFALLIISQSTSHVCYNIFVFPYFLLFLNNDTVKKLSENLTMMTKICKEH